MAPAFSAVLPAPTPALSLFPECPEHSPNNGAPKLAQLCEGPRGESDERGSADCPPQEPVRRSDHSLRPKRLVRTPRSWSASPASLHHLRRRIRGERLPKAGIFCAAGAVHFEPVRFEPRTVRMDDQSVPRLRVRVQILLRAIYARVHGIGRDGV